MKNILLVLVGLVVIGVVTFLGITYPKAVSNFGASAVGSTFQVANQYGVTINFATATTTYIQNTSAVDRYISATKVGCEGVGSSQTAYTGTGLASWQLTVATSSTNVSGTAPSLGAAALTNAFVLGTSTTNLLVASSTLLTATSSNAAIWPAGSYLAFQTNATNTAVCTVSVDAFGS